MTQRYADRRRSQKRQKDTGDPLVAALTLQVVACMLLLALALLVKHMDETRYQAVRESYLQMVSDPAESIQALEEIAGWGAQIDQLFDVMEQTILAIVDRFAASPEHTGQGGQNPVNVNGDSFAGLPPPEGSTYAEVLVTGTPVPPVTGLVTSPYAYRWHPVSGTSDFHTGMDIGAAEGSNILAALPGEVVEVGENDIYGKYIILQHATNLRTFYAHCSSILAGEGVAVRQGERIAQVGQTGVATGPHLHFSVIVEGQFTDPYWLLQDNIQLVEE